MIKQKSYILNFFFQQEELLKETVENLAQENHQLRNENDHLKGTWKATIMRIILCFALLFLFALYLIWRTDRQSFGHVQNSTHGETLVVNIALDGARVDESGLEEKTIASYGNINFNFQCDRDPKIEIKANEDDILVENNPRDNLRSFGKTSEPNMESKFGSSYLNRLSAMKEDIIPRVKKPYNSNTETDNKIDRALEQINEEGRLLQSTKDLARNVESMELEVYEIRENFEAMYQLLKALLANYKKLKEMDHIFEIDHEIYLVLTDLVMAFAKCAQLSNEKFIKQSERDAIEVLQLCDFYIAVQRFTNFMEELRKVQGEVGNLVTTLPPISDSSNSDETLTQSGLVLVRVRVLENLEKKLSGIIQNVKESFHVLQKVDSTLTKLYNYLKPVVLEDIKASSAHHLIEDVKEVLEAYAALSKIKETI